MTFLTRNTIATRTTESDIQVDFMPSASPEMMTVPGPVSVLRQISSVGP